jgi:hypothetical protein
MEDINLFTDKTSAPSEKDLLKALGTTAPLWKEIKAYVLSQYPQAVEKWSYPGAKYGWSFRLMDKKRAIVYLLPRENFFKVAFVFGEKATHEILESDTSEKIKEELRSAKAHAEGRGIRLDIRNKKVMKDITFLIDTKLNN